MLEASDAAAQTRSGADDTECVARSDRAFPSGLVTFAFTDIEGSTQLFRRIGDRYPVLLERHREILRAAWSDSGWEVKTEGDSFFVAFADPIAAISACVRAQRELTAEPWPDDASIRVRMGLHTGLASPHGDDYIALAVHQASRVVDAAHGGQIVVSAATAEQVTGPARGLLRSLGRYRVRDFDEPVELLQATASRSRHGIPAAARVACRPTQSRRCADDDRRTRRGAWCARRPGRDSSARDRRRTGRPRQDPTRHRVRHACRRGDGSRCVVRRPRTAQRSRPHRPDGGRSGCRPDQRRPRPDGCGHRAPAWPARDGHHGQLRAPRRRSCQARRRAVAGLPARQRRGDESGTARARRRADLAARAARSS